MAQIVTVDVSLLNAPTPSKLQRTGAFITQGGTTLTAGNYALITQMSDLTGKLAPAQTLSSLVWATNVVTATTAAAHGFPIGVTVSLTIAGATPAGYNGTFSCTITSTTEFTYPLLTNPGTETVAGTVIPAAVAELTAMGTTFFAQGAANSVYVLELGLGTPASGVTALTTFINDSPQFFYTYLVPREWASEPTYVTFVGNYESTSAKTYFFTTMSLTNYTSFTVQMKDVFGLVEAPAIGATEFSLAAPFWNLLNYNPSSTNKVTPFNYGFVYGVTPYPTFQNGATLSELATANISVIGTAAQGGLSNAMIVGGKTMDGNDLTYWYSVDWADINIALNLADEIINGSNDDVNPLYYDQFGINRLQTRLSDTMNTGASYGLVLGNLMSSELPIAQFMADMDAGDFLGNYAVNAEPFAAYSSENPDDFKIGRYAGLAVAYTPKRGFDAIIVNVVVSSFV